MGLAEPGLYFFPPGVTFTPLTWPGAVTEFCVTVATEPLTVTVPVLVVPLAFLETE
jgi:hypothetical protein